MDHQPWLDAFNFVSSSTVFVKTHVRFIPLAAVLAAASHLMACTTPPAMPMGATSADSLGMPGHLEKIDAQMKAIHEIHAKMMNASTPEERSRLMAEHRKTMQDGMKTMSTGMADMKGMKTMPDDMGAHRQMAKQTEMMQSMMKVMVDQMPPAANK